MRAIDFFCGAGGVTHGFKQAGIDIVCGIDIDISCKETYEKNNNTKFLHADIRTLDLNLFLSEYNVEKNDDNMIFIGCSPCQYYTNLKTDKTKSRESHTLLEDFQRFVEYYKPGYIFIENVPGFEKTPESPIGQFKQFLKTNHYEISDKIINAKNYGVPQNRRRYVLIASRLRKLNFPVNNEKDIKTIYEAIGDKTVFPQIEAGHKDKTPFAHSSALLSEINLKRIKLTKPNGGDRRAWPSELQPRCYKNHSGHYDVYGRMFWQKPAPTITTRFNSYSNGRYGHPEQNRAISLREGATLQSFPLDYVFYSKSQNEIARMIGNAVPPELAKQIARKYFGGR